VESDERERGLGQQLRNRELAARHGEDHHGGEDHRGEKRARGHVRHGGDRDPGGGDGDREQPVLRFAERGSARHLSRVMPWERDGEEQRREQHHHEHAQVLHERHEAGVGPEVVRHRHDPGCAARHRTELGRGAIERREAREQHAADDAYAERRPAH
jgi:hypothetical protein